MAAHPRNDFMFCGSAKTGIPNRNVKFPLGNRRSTVENHTVTMRLPASYGDTQFEGNHAIVDDLPDPLAGVDRGWAGKTVS